MAADGLLPAMADRPDRVACVVRHRADVLTCAEAGARRRLPTAAMAADGLGDALSRLLERLGAEAGPIEWRGGPVETDDGRLVPVAVEVTDQPALDEAACPDPGWTSPAVLAESADDRWWRAYRAVAPTVESVAGDTERGSTAIAVDALWVLRDAAVSVDGMEPVRSTARALLAARPTMVALANRVNRTMAAAETPGAVEAAATEGIVRAYRTDEAAADLAAETVAGGRVLTLSRSGTVRAALLEARPAVVVLASRPGGEGLAVAADLEGQGLSVAAVPDAAVYDRLRSGDVDAVLVGADAITPDGGIVNKVGTRAAALAAAAADVPFYAVAGSDKIAPAEVDAVVEPMFDWTPPDRVSGLLTDRGRLEPADVRPIAREHRALAGWQERA